MYRSRFLCVLGLALRQALGVLMIIVVDKPVPLQSLNSRNHPCCSAQSRPLLCINAKRSRQNKVQE